MFYFDGKEWKKNKCKITYTNTVYDDDPGRYPGGTVEEVTLTSEQEIRYDRARNADMVDTDFLAYVLDGIGEIPTDQKELDELLKDISPEELAQLLKDRLMKEVP